MNESRVRSLRGRLVMFVFGSLLCLLLCACDGCNGFVSGCAKAQEWYRPELASGTDAAETPLITHSPSAEEVNIQLAEYYRPVTALLETANEGRDIFSLEHELDVRDGSYYLHSRILCSPEGEIELSEIYIPYFGPTTLPAPFELTAPGDSRLTAAWLELTANGVDFDLSRLDEQLSVAALMELYVNYYQQLSGIVPDISRFAATAEYDELLRKAMVLGLIELPALYENESADCFDLAYAAAGLLSAVYYDACGCGTEGFERAELLQTIREFALVGFYPDEEWQQSSGLLVRLCDSMLAEESSGQPHEAIRLECAQTFVELYESMYGPVNVDQSYSEWMIDTGDEDCIKASWLGIMPDFPKSYLFAEEYTPGRWELPDFVRNFLGTCRNASVVEWPEYAPVTYRDAMLALSMVDIMARTQGICSEEPTVVRSDRDYEWYYTQHGTGPYSYVNCMPTITMMATRWYDEHTTVTVEEMRDRYLPDNTDGWYTWQVDECLEQNGVPHELVDVSEDKLPYLDSGKIILSQMSEAAVDQSGHCFVIYGYWKRGDSVKYFVHDPDVYDGTDEYGRRPGYAMVMDGRYCDWIIDRIAFNYIVVGD